MITSHLTPSENKLLAKVDALLELCPLTNLVLGKVPKFVQELDLLREKRQLINQESVKKHEAKASKETAVADVSTEKEALVVYMDEAMGRFRVFAKKEGDSALSKLVAQTSYSQLSKQTPLVLEASLNAFVATVEKLDADTLTQYGIDKTWLPTLSAKIVDYKAANASKETLKTNKPKATRQFKSVMADIQDHLNTLTDLLGGYKDKAPEFYENCNALLTAKKKTAKKSAKKTPIKKMAAMKVQNALSDTAETTPTPTDTVVKKA